MRFLIALAALALAACDSAPPEPKTQPTPPPQQAQAAAPDTPANAPAAQPPSGGNARPLADMIWDKPAAWNLGTNASTMRKATYEIPAAEGDSEPTEMSVTQVGGSVEANIARWEQQFEEAPKAKTSESEVHGLKVSVVELEGTFKGGGPMMGGRADQASEGSKKDWAMLAAIVHTSPAHFFKMTGPKKTVQASRADFDVLVGSFAPKP
jgi:hypothetical protein